MFLQEFAQQLFGHGKLVLAKRAGSGEQLRIPHRCPDVARIGVVGAPGVAGERERVAQRAPDARQVRIERGRFRDRTNRRPALTQPRHCQPELDLRRGHGRICGCQRPYRAQASL